MITPKTWSPEQRHDRQLHGQTAADGQGDRMKDLLTRALEAHGGLSRWREIEAFQLKVSIGGAVAAQGASGRPSCRLFAYATPAAASIASTKMDRRSRASATSSLASVVM